MNLLAALALTFALGTHAIKGVALAVPNLRDLDTLGVSWYYNWGQCGDDPRCVNMAYSMQLPISCPKYLLVGNEPNARPPYGSPVSPKEAASRVIAIERKCPETIQVAGNVSTDDWGNGSGYTWIASFLKEYHAQSGKPYSQAIGVHCYTLHDSRYCISNLQQLRGLYNGEMWLTEFGVFSGDVNEFKSLLSFVSHTFNRYSPYTNSQRPCGGSFQGWAIDDRVKLVDECMGQLTPIGKVFAEWNR